MLQVERLTYIIDISPEKDMKTNMWLGRIILKLRTSIVKKKAQSNENIRNNETTLINMFAYKRCLSVTMKYI